MSCKTSAIESSTFLIQRIKNALQKEQRGKTGGSQTYVLYATIRRLFHNEYHRETGNLAGNISGNYFTVN
jgi:hypothetical protein